MTPQPDLGVAVRRPPGDDYDVLVVGARVAGAATAMLLGRAGHRVLLIDRAQVGADTISTHTVLRLGIMQLQRWGLLDRIVDSGAPAIRRVTLGFGSDLVPIDLSHEFGVEALYAPRRNILDPILAQAASESGVELSMPTRLVDVVWDEDRVVGAVIDDGAGRRSITSRYLVGADGVWSRTADKVGAHSYRSYPVTNSVYYAYYRGIDADGVHFQFTPGVTAGLIPTNDDEVCVYVGWPSDRIGEFRADPEKAFGLQAAASHPLIGAAVRHGVRTSPFRGTPGLPGFLRLPSGPGWALVGDAGYTKDPISAHGISDAFRDAELCARAVHHSLLEPHAECDHLSRYRIRRDRLSISLLEKSARLGAYEWDVAEASSLMRGLSEAVRDECEAMLSLAPWAGSGDRLVKAS